MVMKMHVTKGLQGILTRTMSRLAEAWDNGRKNRQCRFEQTMFRGNKFRKLVSCKPSELLIRFAHM